MKSFFKYLLATVVGIILVNLIFFFIAMGVVNSVTKSQREEVKVEPGTVLHLKLSKEIKDRSDFDPLNNFDMRHMDFVTKLGLNDILENIAKAEADSNIAGIFLDLSALMAGEATIEEIRNALEDFKVSGKFVLATADFYTQKSYYLASVADKVYMTPTGSLVFNGMRAEIMYYKNALEKLDVEPVIFRKGKYKSAVEPFMQQEISKANKEQYGALLNAWWSEKLEKIAKARNLDAEELNYLADNIEIRTDKDCKEYGLIDDLLYHDQVVAELKSLTGVETDDKLETVSLNAYKNSPKAKSGRGIARDKIAVVYAEGEIRMGKNDDGIIGAGDMSKALRKARKDEKVKAVVFRVNSPGGSALASEIILREVELIAAEKPIVVSMGNLAASGGYYISAKADKILADNNTITGSIGVFGALFNVEKMLNKKLGISVSTVKTNKHADLGSPFRPIEAAERHAIQETIDTIYNAFVSHVAEGRGMSFNEVHAIAQGRVWSGADAIKIGLVDEIGGLERAVELAKEMAELDDYRIMELPKSEDPFTEILKELGTSAEVRAQKAMLGPLYTYYRDIESFTGKNEIMARMPYNVDIY